MNGVHNMGGMHGFGPIEYEPDEPVFHEPWEGRIFGMGLAARSLRWSRFDLESLEPGTYLSSTYYERWVRAFENVLVRDGVITREELEARVERFLTNPGTELPRSDDPQAAQESLAAIMERSADRVEADVTPRFSIGDTVRTRNTNRIGHTRLPRYTRGRRGEITGFYGIHRLQDQVDRGESSNPQPLYAVRFDASELWGTAAESNESVIVDMWKSYLEAI